MEEPKWPPVYRVSLSVWEAQKSVLADSDAAWEATSGAYERLHYVDLLTAPDMLTTPDRSVAHFEAGLKATVELIDAAVGALKRV